MSENRPETTREPRRLGRHTPLIVALVLLGFMSAFWFLFIGTTAALFYAFGWREGVLVAGGLVILSAILAEFRVSGFEAIFDWVFTIGEMLLEVFATVVSGILGIFGLSWRD